jgi:hypothetical protein
MPALPLRYRPCWRGYGASMTQARRAPIRLALDTNIWSYLGDAGAAAEFERLAERRNVVVVIPPSTLLEVMRLPLAEPRARIVGVMSHARRVRLPSEAELESSEVVNEVRRCRPQWLRQISNTGRVSTFHTYWTKKVWRDAQEKPGLMHAHLMKESSRSNAILDVQRSNRSSFLKDKFDATDLSHIEISTPDANDAVRVAPGWDGKPVAGWRFENHSIYWHVLNSVLRRSIYTGEDATYADWLGAYIDLRRMTHTPEDFTKFWFEDVDRFSVRRNWLRWAVRQSQTSMKVTAGNPYDDQHSAYHLDYDMYLSADKRYIDVLNIVRRHAGFSMAEPRRVSGDGDLSIVERIDAAIR